MEDKIKDLEEFYNWLEEVFGCEKRFKGEK